MCLCCWAQHLCFSFSAQMQCFAALIVHLCTATTHAHATTNCCFKIGGCPVLWPAWCSYLFVMLQHWKKQTGLDPWAGWEAWLQACMHSWHLLVWAGASWPGPICPFWWGLPVYAPQFESMYAGFKPKICVRGILFMEKSVGEVHNPQTFGIPKRKGAVMHPDPLFMNQKFFAQSPKIFARINKMFCLNCKKLCV